MHLSLFRRILSWGGSAIYKFIFPEVKNYNIKVFTCSFRIYNLEKIKEIEIISDDYNSTAELMIKAMKQKLNIIEIPGENVGRKFGNSKMKIIKNIFNTLKTIFLIKKMINIIKMKKKITTIIGTRPEIIKMYPIIKELDKNFDNELIWSGQHYDFEMVKNIFTDVNLRKPNYL